MIGTMCEGIASIADDFRNESSYEFEHLEYCLSLREAVNDRSCTLGNRNAGRPWEPSVSQFGAPVYRAHSHLLSSCTATTATKQPLSQNSIDEMKQNLQLIQPTLECTRLIPVFGRTFDFGLYRPCTTPQVPSAATVTPFRRSMKRDTVE